MKLHRINALLIRNLYLYKRSLPRLMDIFFWPVMDLLLWGFLSVYLNQLELGAPNLVTFLLGGIVFWGFLHASQESVSVAFLEEVWEKNFLNIFVTPLRLSEFLTSTVLVGLVRLLLVGSVMGAVALALYHFNIFQFGFYFIPFALNILLFGWLVGIFITAVIFRFGTSAQVLAFGVLFLIQPFSAVFYPVSALPASIQWISYLLPPTYVFEGMRAVIATGTLPFATLGYALLNNAIYLILVLWFFYRMFARVKEKGLLLKLD
ncbi:MAG: ABC transporter permease [Candidatus Liptonbacteria bacterium]|nr:ABC transporter permease [Candidatus Liptonbacteria bacterium]